MRSAQQFRCPGLLKTLYGRTHKSCLAQCCRAQHKLKSAGIPRNTHSSLAFSFTIYLFLLTSLHVLLYVELPFAGFLPVCLCFLFVLLSGSDRRRRGHGRFRGSVRPRRSAAVHPFPRLPQHALRGQDRELPSQVRGGGRGGRSWIKGRWACSCHA